MRSGPLVERASCVKQRFHVDDGRTVHCLQVPYAKPETVDGQDLYGVEPDRVWAVGRAGAEDPLLGLLDIVTGMDSKHITASTIKPCEDHDPVPYTKVLETVDDIPVEDEAGVGRSLMALLRRCGAIGQGRLHPADRHNSES